MKNENIVVINAIIMDTLKELLFSETEQATITKKYFMETLRFKMVEKASPRIVQALQLVKQGMPPSLAVFMTTNRVDNVIQKIVDDIKSSSKPSSDNKEDVASEITMEVHDCSNCDISDDCDIKELVLAMKARKERKGKDSLPDLLSDEEINKQIDEFMARNKQSKNNPKC